jgi:hypothetical protein
VSDRLTLANAIEDAGIERAKAERVASVIVDIIHDNVATEADLGQVETRLSGEIRQVETTLRGEIRQVETSLRGDITNLRGEIALIEHRLITRLGGLAVVLSGVLFAALRYWPPH